MGLGLGLVVALTLTGRKTQAQDSDPWFGRDKALHFSFSAALAAGGYGGAALLTEDRRWRLVAGAGVALTAGIGKELTDLSGHGDASVRDLAWDAIGTATGLLVAWAIDRLLFQNPRPSAAAP
jgi:putative lipoprotein